MVASPADFGLPWWASDAVRTGLMVAAFFIFGAMTGSFLNVCIHRLPRGESVVRPRSRCPHCQGAIPWRLNLPLVSWLWLRGRCAQCGGPIAVRYVAVELLTALTFAACAWAFSGRSLGLAIAYAVLLAGFLAATCIDFEHFIIPDEITLGGVAAGFLASLLVPELHDTPSSMVALQRSILGILLGAGLVYGILRLGKLLFGRQRLALAPHTTVVFGEDTLHLPGEDLAYGELLYRRGDAIELHAARVELVDRGYANVPVRLRRDGLEIGEDRFAPESVPWMEVTTDAVTVPREAMGLGDVKFMAAIGAFLGGLGVLFALMASAVLGALVGLTAIALRRREWSSLIPYGPYIAVAATIWVFAGDRIARWWLGL